MSRCVVILAVCAVFTAPAPAGALTWSLGTNLGLFSIHGSPSAGNSTVVAWPSNATVYEPAFRLACSDSRHAHEITLDSGLLLLDEAGATVTQTIALASIQEVFLPDWTLSPFTNLGIGPYRETSAERTHASTAWGLGAGVRHAIRRGHGAIRGELRYDHLASDHGSGRPALDSFGLRLGFDLWL